MSATIAILVAYHASGCAGLCSGVRYTRAARREVVARVSDLAHSRCRLEHSY